MPKMIYFVLGILESPPIFKTIFYVSLKKTDNLWKIRILKTWNHLSLQFNSIQLTVEIITKKTFNNFFREFIERSGARLVSIPDAIYDSDLIIVAVPKDFYKVTKTFVHHSFCLIICLKLICAYKINWSLIQ